MSEEKRSSYARLKKKTSLKEILAVATEFERTARDFYSDLAPRVSKSIRYLVEELAEEEQQHYDLFSRLSENPDIVDLIQTEVETPTRVIQIINIYFRLSIQSIITCTGINVVEIIISYLKITVI